MKTIAVRTVGGNEKAVIVVDEIACLMPETDDVTIILLKGGGTIRADVSLYDLHKLLAKQGE